METPVCCFVSVCEPNCVSQKHDLVAMIWRTFQHKNSISFQFMLTLHIERVWVLASSQPTNLPLNSFFSTRSTLVSINNTISCFNIGYKFVCILDLAMYIIKIMWKNVFCIYVNLIQKAIPFWLMYQKNKLIVHFSWCNILHYVDDPIWWSFLHFLVTKTWLNTRMILLCSNRTMTIKVSTILFIRPHWAPFWINVNFP